MTDPNTPGTTKQAMPFDSLLAQSRNLVCELLGEALDGMLDKVDDTLSALMSETQDPEMRKLYSETRNKALAQRKTIAEQFRAQYLREFQARSNRVRKTGQSFSDLDSYSLELDLVGEDDLNETLKLNDMATKLRQYCDEELVALDQRVGVLLGDANLEAEDNPFSPKAICDAYKLTCRQVDSNVKVRMVLLTLFDDHVLDDIRSVYKAVNALLVQNSILPKIRFRVARGQEGSKAPPAAARAAEETQGAVAHAVDRGPGGEQDFFSVLQNLIAGSVKAMTQPGATAGTGASAQGVAPIPGLSPVPGASAPGVAATPGSPPIGMPGSGRVDGAPVVVLQGAELMNLLTRVQHGDANAVADGSLPMVVSAGEPGTTNVLRELKASSVGTGMNQLDSMTLDIVAMLFDQLFDDPKIPIAVKGLIGRMQIPMLKVAIADKAFFSKKNHPARVLLDTLGEISSRLPADFSTSNPLFARLEAIIQELMNNFQDNIEIFDVVRERLQILVEEEDRRVEEETRSTASRLEQNERLAASKTMAEYEVKTRVQDGNLPRPVIEFLMHQWVKPLLIVHVRRGQHSDAWKNAVATMDLLIWSVEAKHTPEERQDLTTVVPELFKRLTAGLKIADIEDAIRDRFFSDLKKLHSEAVSAGGVGEVAEAQEAGADNLSAEFDTAPAMQFDVVPAAQPDVAPATNPDALPVMSFEFVPPIKPETAPAAKPDAAPATSPDALHVMQFDAGPAKEPEAVPAAKPDAAPATSPDALPVMSFEFVPPIKPETGPAARPDAATATSPDALHVMQFDAAPAKEPEAVPAAKPDVAPAASPDALHVMQFDAGPAKEPEAVPAAKPDAAPAAKPATPPTPTPAVAPAAAAQAPKPVAAPLTKPDAVPPAKPGAAPIIKPVAAPATKPAAPPAATPVVAPGPVAQTPKPVAAPAAKPVAAPTEKPAAPAAAAQTPKPAAAPAAKPVAAPTGKPAAPAAVAQTPKPAAAPLIKPDAVPAAKPGAAPVKKPDAVPATKPVAMQVTRPGAVPAAKPGTAPVIKPGVVPATNPAVAPAAPAQVPKPQPAPAGKPLPEPRKTVQPIAASASKVPAAVEAQGADSDSLDFTKILTIKNPFGAGQVHVKELETADVRAEGAPRAKGEVNEVEFIKNLKEGTWVEFRDKAGDDTHKPAKLSYISPLRSSFLFVDKQGKTVKECSRTELGRLVRLGMVVVVDAVAEEAPLFDRMMAGIIGKLT